MHTRGWPFCRHATLIRTPLRSPPRCPECGEVLRLATDADGSMIGFCDAGCRIGPSGLPVVDAGAVGGPSRRSIRGRVSRSRPAA